VRMNSTVAPGGIVIGRQRHRPRSNFVRPRPLQIRAVLVECSRFASLSNLRNVVGAAGWHLAPTPRDTSPSAFAVAAPNATRWGRALPKANNRSISTCGSITTCVEPSRQVFFSEYATRPSGSNLSRLSAIAGRPAYRHRCSSRLRSPAATRTAPCNEKPSKSAHSVTHRRCLGNLRLR
jgi:hypothetical protein